MNHIRINWIMIWAKKKSWKINDSVYNWIKAMKSKFNSKIAYCLKMMCIAAKKQKTKGLTIKIVFFNITHLIFWWPKFHTRYLVAKTLPYICAMYGFIQCSCGLDGILGQHVAILEHISCLCHLALLHWSTGCKWNNSNLYFKF